MFPLLSLLMPIIGNVLEKVIPDPQARAKAQADLLSQLMAADTSQMEVNKAEAQSEGNFKGGWRPFIGWVCGAALAYQYLIVPIAMWMTAWAGHAMPKPPTLDDQLWQLMFGLLGMGALRSFDKMKGGK